MELVKLHLTSLIMPSNVAPSRPADGTAPPLLGGRGFSLVEMMVVVSILGILAAIGMPSYQQMISSTRILNEINDLRGHLEYARSEALKRGQTVVVCPSSDGSSCDTTSQNWEKGWIVFATSDTTTGGCTVTSGTGSASLLKIHGAFTSTDTALFTPFNGANRAICFTRMGLLAAAYTGWFSFNASPAVSNTNRCLTLSTAGRAQVVLNGKAVTSNVNCS